MRARRCIIGIMVIIIAAGLTATVRGMLSKMPADVAKLTPAQVDMELLRIGIIAELDAINLYEQLAASTENKILKKIFLDVAREEKTHHGEFEAMLLKLDKELKKELEEGKEEIEELLEK